MNSGDFFQPLSAVMALGILGALVSGWRTPLQLRFWLWLGFIMFLIIWAITPTVFWPMIHELYGSAIGRISRTDAELVQPAHRWVVWDWFRVVLIAIGFVASVRALTLPVAANGSILTEFYVRYRHSTYRVQHGANAFDVTLWRLTDPGDYIALRLVPEDYTNFWEHDEREMARRYAICRALKLTLNALIWGAVAGGVAFVAFSLANPCSDTNHLTMRWSERLAALGPYSR
jgi:hypothetical protein